MITSQYENKLLQLGRISLCEIRDELEQRSTGNSLDESEVNDEFSRYKSLIDLFGNSVFQYDRITKTVSVNPNFKARSEYILCLACIYGAGSFSDSKQKRLSRLFEKVVCHSLRSYLGCTSKCLEDVDDLSGENLWDFCKKELFESPNESVSEYRNKNMKDILAECDLIVWSPFVDKRGGKLILLVQCRSGKNWTEKGGVNIDLWKGALVNFCSDPVKVYAIADIEENAVQLLNRSKQKGLIIDRARIVSLLALACNKELQDIRKEIEDCNLEECIQI